MLRLEDAWAWDSWIADDGEQYHLFFLHAPRSLGRGDLRHTAARVGHAVSADLLDWTVLTDALAPAPGSWDDLAIWTGSVLRGDDGPWRMFYTALSSRGYGARDQRIGVAESDDLLTWRRPGPEPLLSVDPRWYASIEEDETVSETWRDPFVVRDEAGDGWQMLFTARARGVERLDDGVLGHAWSNDLRRWEVRPPLTGTGHGFGQLEVPQVRVVEGTHVLVFTCHPHELSAARRAEHGDFCTWAVTGQSLLGPWDLTRAVPFTAEPELFAAPLVQRRDGSWVLLGFRNLEPEGIHDFEVLDPIPVHLEGGGLVADASYVPNPPHPLRG